jgi:hypothetical protein
MTDQVQIFFHVRILTGVVLALGITRILTGIPKYIEKAREEPGSATHFLWIGNVLLMAIHFWWFEFELMWIVQWHFSLFVFVLLYAFLFTLMATLLVPDKLGEHSNYDDYFMDRRPWFFALLAATIPADLIDTMLKGRDYYMSLGIEYPIRLVVVLLLCGIAAWSRNRRFHFFFAAGYFIYYLTWILRLYDVLE